MKTDLELVLILIFAVLAAGASSFAAWAVLRLRAVLAAARRDEERLEQRLREEAADTRREIGEQARGQRSELAEGQRQFLEDARKGRSEQAEALERFGQGQRQALQLLTEAQAHQAEALRGSLEAAMQTLRGENAEKLEQMRRPVDEKLHETLERRLGESFKLVSDRLEQVHKGLGEMQTLANGVGDLKRVLGNVKTRGGWGEVQLENILEQIFTPEQFARQVTIRPGSRDAVDCAIRLPGRGETEAPVWLPIDAKFPSEDYERLIDAQERDDLDAIKNCGAQLQRAVETQAKSISDKYIAPPHTTDFAVMFLPTEGLYAEVIRRPGLVDKLQREWRVVLAGPTTLTALLNSLQMGFRTLAIEKRSSEVWQVLGAVKTEFGKFGDVLDKVKKKLDEASNQIDQTGIRTRAISRHLKGVEELPAAQAENLLGAAADADEGD